MRKRIKKIASVVMATVLLATSLPANALAADPVSPDGVSADKKTVTASAVGEIKNVKNTMSLTGSYSQLCLRPLTGTLNFTWPDNQSYVDVVFIQDFSGSFDGTIDKVGTAINNIVNTLDMGKDVDGTSPKDRVMITTFQGSQGRAVIDDYGVASYTDQAYSYKVSNWTASGNPLMENKATITAAITNNYTAANTDGGTPTVDGMRYAQSLYQSATNTSNIYDNTTYTLANGAKRQRETIYVLLTDGAANTAKWSNLPTSTKTLFDLYGGTNSPYIPGNISSGTWKTATADDGYSVSVSSVDESLARRYNYSTYTYDYYYGGYYYYSGGYYYYYMGSPYNPGSENTSYNWSDVRNSPDGDIYNGYTRVRTENYKVLLNAMEVISNELKVDGGLDKGNAKMVTAFWENLDPSTGLATTNMAYGSGWYNMRPYIMNSMTKMATSSNYFATSSNLTDFTNKLITSFKEANASTLNTIKFDLNKILTPGSDYKLIKIGDNPATTTVETEYAVTPGPASNTDNGDITIDMTNFPAGDYKIVYSATENEFMSKPYNPISNVEFSYNGMTSSLNTTATTTEGNPKTDCDIDVKKYVASNKDDYNNANTYKELEKRRQPFYFDTKYSFTAKVQAINNTMVLKDVIDSRLDILDVYLVAANDTAKLDAISSATINGTLIAEMKGGDSGDLSGVPSVSVDKTTNTVLYNLPKQPKTIDGKTYPFGGYEGKEYVLVVKAQIKSTVTDAQIDEMINTPNADGRPQGVPNTSQIITDGEIKYSNEVRAVPPALQEPTIRKAIAKIPAGTDPTNWKDGYEYLDSAAEKYRHKIELDMPVDTTGYQSLVVKDPLDPYLNYDAASVKTYYLKKDGTRVDIAFENLTRNLDAASNTVTYTIKETSTTPNLFEDMAEGKVIFEFDVQLKAGVDLSKRYVSQWGQYEINNISSYSLNGRDPKPSNVVQAIIPTPSVTLTKFGKMLDQNGNRLPLFNAKFELKDTATTNTETPRAFITNIDGKIDIDKLTPGKKYTLTEIDAPDGYVVDKTPWTIVVNADNTVTITGGPTNPALNNKIDSANKTISVNNNGPVSPTPEKMLHGELDPNADFKKPTMDSPYKLVKNGENITYQIRVPIGSVEGYTDLKIEDNFDKYLSLDIDSAKAYTIPDSTSTTKTNVGGTFSMKEGNTFVWEKTGAFSELENKILIIEVNAKAIEDVAKVFADTSQPYYVEGKIPNKATLTLNNEPAKVTNETVVQLTKSEVSLAKLIKGTGEPDANAIPLPDGLTASFILYRLRDSSVAEPSPTPDQAKDTAIGSYTVNGSEILKIPLLDTGKYYFIESSAPQGYAAVKGPIPQGLINVPESTGGAYTITDVVNPINEKTTTPTIDKKIRALNGQYSKEDLKIDIGQEWQYAIDVPLPSPLDTTSDYTITDSIPSVFQILGAKVMVGDGTNFTENTELNNFLRQNTDYANPNNLKLVLTKATIESLQLQDKVIRIEVNTKVKPGTDILNSGLLRNAVVPNTAYLQFGDVKLDSTVNVKPTILRNFSFTKNLGKTPLAGATFKLYTRNPDGSMSIEPAKNPFTGEVYSVTSGENGAVSFKDVPAGEYIMVETAPTGTFPIYDNILVSLADTDAPNTDESAVRFRTTSGTTLSETDVVNNTGAKISGTKFWDDEDNRYNNRPAYIVVKLYRYVSGQSPDSKQLIETKTVTSPWTYEFKDTIIDGVMTNKYPKYDDQGNEYVYVVDEEPVPAYTRVTDGVTGYDLKNKIDPVSLNVIKKDTNGNALSGRKFIIINENGNVREHITDANGILSIPDLTKGETYILREEFSPDDKYMNLNSSFNIEIDLNGNVRMIGLNKVPVPVDLDNNPATQDFAFEIINHEKTTPVKKVGPADGSLPSLDNYDLKVLKDHVTYSVTQDTIALQGINSIVMKDTVDPSMAVVAGSGKVIAISSDNTEEDVTALFTRELSDVGRTITFTTGSNYAGFEKLDGKKLRFTFDAYVAVGPERLVELHPDLSIPNTGQITFNDNPDTTVKTNEVNITTDLADLSLVKKVQGLDASGNIIVEALPDGASATFDLYDADTNQRLNTYTTDATGKIQLTNFDVRKYMLRETQSPDGYNKVADIYFNVVHNDSTGKLEVQMLDGKDGNVTKTIQADATTGVIPLDDVVDPMPELPTINKMVKGQNDVLKPEDPATPGPENKDYTIPQWDSKFDYIIDIKIPADTKQINKLDFSDILPNGLIMYDASLVKHDFGTGVGSDFVAAAPVAGGDFYFNAGMNNDGLYAVNLGTQDQYTIDRLAGKTVRLTIPVMIDPEKKLLSELDLVDGKFVNTGTLKINDKYTLESTANATPPKQFGAEFIKLSTSKEKLAEATFKLEQHKDANGVPDGPAIPEGVKVDFISGSDGRFSIENRLPAGKYYLTENYTPTYWIDKDGVAHYGEFTGSQYYYTIEFGQQGEKKDASGATVMGPDGKPVMIDVVKLYYIPVTLDDTGNEVYGQETLIAEYPATYDQPIEIINEQLVSVPVIKKWNDNNNIANTRPKTINFLLQRVIVNGKPDVIDPETGKLLPEAGDPADTLDTEFNTYANDQEIYNKTVQVSAGNTQSLTFTSDTYMNYGETNHLNMLRYTKDGQMYRYFVVESGSDGYKTTYAVEPQVQGDGAINERDTGTFVIDNTLKTVNMKLNKVDNSSPAAAVVGAKFNLSYESNGGTVTKTLTTDASGAIDLGKDIYPNKVYTLTEIEAPAGYLKNSTVYTIVTDMNNTPTVYTKYIGPGDPGNVPASATEFKSTVDTTVTPNVTNYDLTVVDNKTTTHPPEKKVNGASSYNLESLTKDFEYSVEVPITSVEGYKTFVLEDTVNDLVQIVPGSETVTADGKDIKSLGTVEIVNKTIKFTIDKSAATDAERTATFDQIKDRTVKLTFRAKVADGVTLDQLKQYVSQPGNNAGVPNTAKLTINDTPANSNTVYVVPGEPGTPPEVTKTVNGKDHYDLNTIDEVFNYKVEAKVPTNVLGYNSLSLVDSLEKILEVSGGVKLSVVDANGVVTPLVAGKDYILTNTSNTDPNATTNGTIEAKFVDGYDYTKLAGKTVVMEFSSKIKTGVTQEQLKTYEEGIFFKDVKLHNTANIVLNDTPGTKADVTVTPPTEPEIKKGAVDENGNVQPDSIKLQKEQMDQAIAGALVKPVTFSIDAYVPMNVSGYKKFVISDQLNDVLKYKDASVVVDGITDTSDIVIAESNGLVTATITGETNVAKYAGKKITLTINTEIDQTKNISDYVVADKINNTAKIVVNDAPKVEDGVDLLVPKGSLEITKTLDGATTWPAGEKAVFKLEKYVDNKLVTVKDSIEITSLDPVTIGDLELGKYKLTEVSAPAGYEVASPKDIIIDPNTNAVEKITINDTKTPTQEKKVDKNFFEDFSKERTFTITTPVNSVDGINNLLIEDTLDNYFKIVDGSLKTEIVKADGSASVDPAVTAAISGQKISLNLNTPELLAKVKDSKIVITYKVTLKDASGGVFIYDNLPDEYKKNGIPNASTIKVNNNPSVSTEPVKVTVPVGNVSLVKKADNAALPDGTSATFALYKKSVDGQADAFVGSYSTSKIGGIDKIDVKDLGPGQYYFKETSAPAGYVLNDTAREFEIVVDANGATSTVYGAGFDLGTVNNTKSTTPSPVKTVNDLEHVDLKTVDETFKYRVEVPVDKVDGWTEFTLSDPVDQQLTIDNTTVKVNIESATGTTTISPDTIGADGEFTIVNNLITFKYTNMDKVKALVGSKVILTFDAKITNITEFLKAHPDAIVGNTANLNVGNGATSSNTVTVTPPGETPTPVKTVNGRDSLTLGKRDQRFFYDIRTQIPTNVTGYESLTLSDKLKDVLETSPERVTVYVNDVVNDDLKAKFLTLSGQEVVFKIDNATLDPDFDFKTLAGKTLRVGIEANIKDSATDAQLAAFKNPSTGDVQVPNDSTLTINNDSKVSNTVNITPPGDEPTVEKTVEKANDATSQTKDNLLIEAKNTPFTYKVNVAVPSNVEGYKSIKLEDTLEDVLDVSGTQVLIDGTVDNTLSGLVKIDATNPNNVSLDVPSDSTNGYKAYAGKTITLVINAKVKDSVTTDQIAYKYGNSAIPNDATLTFNGQPKVSNEVKVTPPSETPTPVKDVNAQQAISLNKLDEEFVYNVRYTIPTNVTGFDTLTMTDQLKNVLEIAKNGDGSNKIQVFVDEKLDTSLTNKVSVADATGTDGQKISLDINKGFMTSIFGSAFEDLAGKTIRVEMRANIKEGADLSPYANTAVPNDATLSLNGNPKTSNTVIVTPPPGDTPTLDKTVNDVKEYKLGTLNEEHTYKIKSAIPANITGYQNITIKDDLEDILEATSVTVTSGGTDITANIGDYGTLTQDANGLITLNITKNFTALAGKELVLNIKAKVKDGLAPEVINPYLNKGSIPNTASLVFNNNPEVKDSVNVIPPGETPGLDKKVNGQDEVSIANINDPLTYTMDITVPQNTNDITKISLSDTFINIFKLSSIDQMKVEVSKAGTVDDALSTSARAGLSVDGQTVALNIVGAAEANKYAGSVIRVTVPATIDTSKNLADYLVAGKLPNTANLSYSNDPTKDIKDEARVTPPGEDPTPHKDVDRKDSLDLTKIDQTYTYHVNAKVPSDVSNFTKYVLSDDLEDVLETSKGQVLVSVNGQLSAELTGLVTVDPGNVVTLNIPKAQLDSYRGKNIEIAIESRLKAGVTAAELAKYVTAENPNGSIPNTANLALTDNPTEDKKSNTVPVTPPGETPGLDKKVNNEDQHYMPNTDEALTYTMDITVPVSTKDITKINLTDTFLDILVVGSPKVEVLKGGVVDNTLTTSASAGLSVNGQTVALNINGATEANKYSGTTIRVTVPATIDKTKNLASYLVGGTIPNTADLVFNDTPEGKISDDAKVVPPGEVPNPTKDVNGQASLKLTSLDQVYTYHVKSSIPNETTTLQKYTLVDDLEDILTPSRVVVNVNGVENVALTSAVRIDPTNVVTLDIQKAQLDTLKGANIEIAIDARIKAGVTAAELAKYVTAENPEGSIPNQAVLKISDNPSDDKKTEIVPVTPPPGEQPPVEKKVNGQDEYVLKNLNEEHTYTVTSKIPANVNGYQKLVLKDQLVSILEATGVTVSIGGADVTGNITDYGTLTNVNGLVELTLDKKFADMAGKDVVLTIKARVSATADKAELDKYLAAGSIPNDASLTFNNNPEVKDSVKVIPPGETPGLDKKVNGQDEVSIANINDPLTYTMDITVPQNTNDITKISLSDTFINIFKLASIDQMKVEVSKAGTVDNALSTSARAGLSVDGQTVALNIVGAAEANKYAGSVIRVTVPATIDTSKNLADYLVAGKLPNTANLSYSNDPTKDIKDEARVTPPGEDPTPHKDVDRKDSLDLTKIDQTYTYHVNAKVPSDVSNFTKYVLSDDLEDVLETSKGQVLVSVNGQLSAELTGLVTVDPGNVVTLNIPKAQLDSYRGKNIEIAIESRIKAGVTAAELAKYVTAENPNGSIPNTANLALTDNPAEYKKSNTVPVTPPPGEQPPVEKKVNGQDEYVLKNLNEEHTYTVTSKIPANVNGYQKLVLKDQLVSILEATGVTVSIGGADVTGNITDYGTLTNVNGLVELTLDKKFADMAGKDVVLTIKAKVSATADKAELDKYLAAGSIPNDASLAFNNSPEVTDSVKVIPPGETPGLDKKVNGQDAIVINNIDEKLSYTMDITVPNNTKDITKINLTDTFIKIFKLGTPSVEVKKNGVVDATLTASANNALSVSGQTVALNINGKDEANKYAGTVITVTTPATVDTSKNLADYLESGVLPNTADLVFNDTPEGKISDDAKVTPPNEDPTPVKDVNGQDKLDLTSIGQEYTYHVSARIPSDVSKFTKYVLSDDLEDVLYTSKEQVQVKVNGSVDSNLTNMVNVTNNNVVTLDIPMANIDAYKGKNVELSIKSKIKDGITATELAKYATAANPNGSIPNTANLALTDNPSEDKKSNTVPVTPPPGEEPTVEKKVNGQDIYVLKDRNEEHTYTVASKIPTNVIGYKKLVLRDQLVDVLDATNVSVSIGGTDETANIGNYGVLNNTNGLVELTLDKNFDQMAGKDVVLTIKAKVKDGADISKYQTAGSIPNTAELIFNDNPAKKDSVQVIPPGENPPPGNNPGLDKKVNGQDAITINNIDEKLSYTMDITVPKNTKDITKINLTDTFIDIFKLGTPSVEVKKDGAVDAVLTASANAALSVNGQTVSLDINGKEEAAKYAGTVITVTSPATIDASKNVADYLEAGLLPNTAYLVFNDTPEGKISDNAKVVPPGEEPGEKPGLDKKVNGQDAITINNIDEKLSYTMDITVPKNTKDITKINLTDTFIDIFKLGTPSVEVKKDGAVDAVLTASANAALSVNGQTVSLDINGKEEAAKYAGTVITVTSPATIDASKNIADYLEAGVLPNTADLVFNDTPEGKISDDAKVTPPPVTPLGEAPSIEKKVNGADEYKLKDKNEEHTYTITSKIPTNVEGYKRVLLSDQLESVLEVGAVSVSIGGVDVTDKIGDYGTLTNVNGKVELLLDKNFTELAGKDVVLTIKAKVKDGADLSAYKEQGYIPNTAQLFFNDEPAKEDSVKVIPPGETPPPNPDQKPTPDPTPEPTPVVHQVTTLKEVDNNSTRSSSTNNSSSDSSSTTKRLVSTGDGRSPYFYAGVSSLLGLGLILFGLKRRKDESAEANGKR